MHNDSIHRLQSLVVSAALGVSLAACVVVPVDPRTGQPYPAPAAAVVAAPSVAPAAPTPVHVRLYPVNPRAHRNGPIAAHVFDNHGGRGTFTVAYLGDVLQGESTRVDASHASFGVVHQEVLGAGARTWTGRRGIANAFGSRGVDVQCEYVLAGSGAGTGVCRFSDGAHYQMHFGG